MRLLFLVTGAVLFCSAVDANVLYSFSYDAVSGPVQSFSLSFSAPAFVTDGSSPAFTPFASTDGTNSWTMTNDLVAVLDPAGLNRGCFMFGTPFAELAPPGFGPCVIGVGGPGDSQAAIDFDTSGGLPSAPGTYAALHFGGIFDTAGGFENIGPLTDGLNNTGTMTLTVTDTSSVPEPSTLPLIVIGLLTLRGTLARRLHKTGRLWA